MRINQEREIHNSISTRTQISEFNQWMKLLKKTSLLKYRTSDSRMPFRNVPFLLPTSEMKYWRLSLSNSTLHWTYCCNERTEIICSHHIFPLCGKKCQTTALMPKSQKSGVSLLKSLWHRYITVGQKFQEQNKISHLVIKLIHVFSTPYWLQHLVFSTHVKLSFLCKRTIK